MDKKKDNLLALEASSPEELKKYLASLPLNETVEPRPVVLSISGPKVMVCPFDLKDTPYGDIKHHLLGEAVELMSMTSDAIEIDIQLTKSEGKDRKGVYLCAPKDLIESYLMILDDNRLRPVAVTEHFLTCVNALYREGKADKGRVGALYFSSECMVHLFVANNGGCEMLRKIPFENFDEMQAEVVQSLRSASAKSWPKHYDVIYCSGDLEGADDLEKTLNRIFNTKLEQCPVAQEPQASAPQDGYFQLNLLRQHVFSPQRSRQVQMAASIILTLCALNFLALNVKMMAKGKAIDQMKSSYEASQYQYAADLIKNIQ